MLASASLGKPPARQSRITTKARTSTSKHSHAPSGGLLMRGNNAVPYVESERELEARRLAAQRTAVVVAARATAILKAQQQRDPDVLDLRSYTMELDDVLLTEIAEQLRANRAAKYFLLVLSGCAGFTPVGLRSLVHVIGDTLRRLDCSHTVLSVPMLQVLASGIERLDALDFSSCPKLLNEGVREFISCCNTSLTRLNLSRCAALTDDALGWIGGALGPQGSRTRCRRLLSLDMSYTNAISDRGLVALSSGCHTLQFLNLEGLERISAAGVLHIMRGCRALRVLSLKRCLQLSDATLEHIGKHGAQLRSLNISGCYALSSAGLLAMVPGTPLLQALSVEGCLHMREDILAAVATACPSLQMLNVTGCQEITDAGLKTLAENMPFVQKARTYRGLEPRDDGLQIKYSVQQQTIRASAALRLQAFYRGHLGRRVAACWRVKMVEAPASRKIRRCYVCWDLRHELELRVKRTRLVQRSAVRIQSLVRGVLGRAALTHSLLEERRLSIWAVYAVKVQAAYRRHWTRHHFVLVHKTMERYHLEQHQLQREAAATSLQRCYRARFSRSRFEDLMTLNQRRRKERVHAAVTLQRLFRTRAARRAYRQLLAAVAQQQEEVRALARIAVKLQSNWRGHRGRKHELTRVRAEAQALEKLRGAAASRINAGVRGYFGRRYARKERVRVQTRLRAARVIQRAWRVHTAPTDERLNYDAFLVQLRESSLHEGNEARAKQTEILRKARELVNRDSASEPESDDDWRDFQDERGDQFWFSPSRNERLYVRPNDHAREKIVLQMPCRVLWPHEQRWFDGRVTQYNWKKGRHRVDYDDGDHEWLSIFHADASRVQLFNGSCWCMAAMLEPTKRSLRAAVFLRVCFQRYDPRLMAWRTGVIQAYHEPSDVFLLTYDSYDDGSGLQQQQEQEWVNVFATENHFQLQDSTTRLWYSLSGFVFGHTRGRPLDLLVARAQQNERYWYSVADYLDYEEEAFVQKEQVDGGKAAVATEEDGDASQVEGELNANSDDEDQESRGEGESEEAGDSGDEQETSEEEEESEREDEEEEFDEY